MTALRRGSHAHHGLTGPGPPYTTLGDSTAGGKKTRKRRNPDRRAQSGAINGAVSAHAGRRPWLAASSAVSNSGREKSTLEAFSTYHRSQSAAIGASCWAARFWSLG